MGRKPIPKAKPQYIARNADRANATRAGVTVEVKPPRTETEADNQIRAFLDKHKSSMKALADL